MPLATRDVRNVKDRVMKMFLDTIDTFGLIEQNAKLLYGRQAPAVRAAILECLEDFVRNPQAAGETHPEVLIHRASKRNLQRAGLYGAQLAIKERQVKQANRMLRASLRGGMRRAVPRHFRKWVDVINNFLGSLAPATGLGEALKELKDCLRDQLPDEERKRLR